MLEKNPENASSVYTREAHKCIHSENIKKVIITHDFVLKIKITLPLIERKKEGKNQATKIIAG